MKFEPTVVDINYRIPQVIRHRLANQNKYNPTTEPQFFDFESVRLEIEQQLCDKRPEICGGNPIFNRPKVNILSTPTEACTKCGATDWKAILCPTCSRMRVTGYTCNQCGNKV